MRLAINGTRVDRRGNVGNARMLPLLAFVVLLLWVAWPAAAQSSTDDDPAGATWVEVGRQSGEGEQCLVCRVAIDGEESVAIRYKGRTFHVKSSMVETFAEDPDHYFALLEARGALFDERALNQRSMSFGWLLFGSYILIGLITGAICGALAIARGLSPLPWFFAGVVGNVIAVVVLLIRQEPGTAPKPEGWTKVRTTHVPRPCANCGNKNHPAASACSSCGHALVPAFEAETGRA